MMMMIKGYVGAGVRVYGCVRACGCGRVSDLLSRIQLRQARHGRACRRRGAESRVMLWRPKGGVGGNKTGAIVTRRLCQLSLDRSGPPTEARIEFDLVA